MRTRGAAATFDVGTFIYSDGAFELTGTWTDSDGLGRVRLLVDIDGRERNIGATRSTEAEDGPGWTARFLSSKAPGPDATATLVAGDVRVELPPPVVSDTPLPPPPPRDEPAASDDGVRGAEALLQQLRSERQALEQARDRLAQERRAAEQVEQRLRGLTDRTVPARPPLSKRPEQRVAEELDWAPLYWVCGAVAFCFLLVLIWVL